MGQVYSTAARRELTFGVLGPLQVKDGDEVLPLPGAKERALLAHLVACVGRTVSTDELVEALWNGDTPRTATKVLQNHVLRLRKVLEPHRDGDAVLLVTDPGGYRLDAPGESVDALEFERLTLLGRRAAADRHPAAAAETLRAALSLWRGRAYAGLESTSFGLAEARRLDALRQLAVEDRVAADLELGRAGELVHELEALVAAEPLRERLWYLLMLALYRCGRQGEALGVYMRARRLLGDELGIDPGQELRQLQSRILIQDPSLGGTGPGATLHRELTPPGGPHVGRDRELAQLSAAWQLAVQVGRARVVVVRGPPGSGVSRLAAEFAARLADAGVPVDFVRPAPAVPTATAPLAVATAGQLAGVHGAPPTGMALAALSEHGGPPRPMPALLVADLRGGWDEAASVAELVGPAALTVILAHPDLKTPPAAQVIDLAPLDVSDVAAVLAEYLGPEAARRLAPAVLRTADGWPGPIHDAAVSEARRVAAAKVNGSAARVEQAVTTLDAYRDDLRSRVEESRLLLGIRSGLPADRCPWKGLGPYQPDDEAPFAGRERLVAELLARVVASRLVVVVGASGSGKTSLLNAGLLASLAAGALPGSERWVLARMRPGPRPRVELARTARSDAEPALTSAPSRLIEPGLAAKSEGTVLGPKPAERVVLVVDQLEEIWTVCDDPDERSAFLDALADMLDQGSPTTLVLACRSDHVGRLADHPRLAALLPAATLLVGSPTGADLRRVIGQPAEQAGLRLDVGLVDALVEDAGAEPGILPLLSTSLTELWEGRSGRTLTLAAYVATGGLRGAVARVAEHAYQALDPHYQRSARLLFLRLAGPGTGDTVTRRAVSLDELAAFDDPTVRLVVEPLVHARLLTVNGDDVEVAHEALFREWPRLRAWLDEQATTRTVQRRLAQAARDWHEGGREPSELWRGSRLAGGLDVLTSTPDELTERERAFVLAGQAEQEAEHVAAEAAAAATARQNRRLRALLAGTAVLLVLALVAGTLAVQSRRTAQDQAAVAAARELAAAAAGLVDTDAELAVLLALEAVDRSTRVGEPLPEAVSSLHAAVTADRVLAVHDGVGGSLSISPNGATYVAEGPEGSGMVDLRDSETGTSVRKWDAHDVGINQVEFGPTGTLATTGDDGTLALWDPDTGRELQRITGDGGNEVVVDPTFNADGTVASAHWFGSVQRVLEVGSDQPSREFRGPIWVSPGSVDPTGTLVAYGIYGDDDWRIEVAEVAGATAVLTLAGRFFSFPNAVRWSPDGRWIAAMIEDELRVWDARTGSMSRTFTGHEKLAAVLDWTADSTQVVTGGEDGTVRLWSLDGSAPMRLLSAASTADGVTGVDYDDRTSRVLAGNYRGTQVTVFDARPEGGGEWLTLTSPADPFAGTAFLPDGRLVTPGRESGVSMTDPRSGQATPTMADARGVMLAEPSPNGQFLAVWRLEAFSVVELATGQTRFTQPVSRWRTPLIAWHPDSTKLAVPDSATDGGTTSVFDLQGRVLATVFERGGGVNPLGVVFSPDGHTLVTGRGPDAFNTNGWGVTFWNWRRGRALLELPDEHAVAMAFAADGSSLALANPNGAVLIDPATGERQVALGGARGGVSAVAFSTDSTLVATAEVSGAITLWDAATGTKQLTLPGHDEMIGGLDFSPDGTMLASAGGDGLTRVWALDLNDLITVARDRVSRTLTAEECRQYLHGVGC